MKSFGLLNLNRDALRDHLANADDVPIRRPHTAVAGPGADAVRVIGAVNADAGFVKADPTDSDGVIRAGREHVEIAGAFACFEDAFIPAERRHGCDAKDLPISWRSGMRG